MTYFYFRQFYPQSVVPRQCILVSVFRQTINYPFCVESLSRHNDETNYVYTIIVHGYVIMSVCEGIFSIFIEKCPEYICILKKRQNRQGFFVHL